MAPLDGADAVGVTREDRHKATRERIKDVDAVLRPERDQVLVAPVRNLSVDEARASERLPGRNSAATSHDYQHVGT